MATYTVQAPDGRSIKVEAPEGASDADLIRIAQGQLAATTAPATSGEKLLASPLGRTAKGLKDPIDAGAQLLPRGLSLLTSLGGMYPNSVSQWLDKEAQSVDADIKASEQDYQNARWKSQPQNLTSLVTGKREDPGFDGMRLLGNIVNPTTFALSRLTPSGATSMLGRTLQGGAAGLVGGVAATPVLDTTETSFGMQKLGQGLTGAAGGAVATPVLGKIADVAAPLVKKIVAKMSDPAVLGARSSLQTDIAIRKAMEDAGISSQNVPQQVMDKLRQEVLDSMKQGQKFDASARLRQMDFEAEKVPALRGQITRDPAQYSRDMNVRGIEGVGEPVAQRLQAQNQAITQGLAGFGGPKAAEKFQAGEQMTQALSKLDEQLSGNVRRAYQNARASAGKDWDVPMQGLAQDVAGVIDDFGVGAEKNAVPSAIVSRLKSFGVVADDGMKQRKVFNYEEADKLLKQINAHDDGQNASIGALRAAVKKAILEGGGEGDPFAPARKLAAERFQLLDAIPALDAVVKGKAAPDDFVQKFIIGGKVKDLQKLKSVLPDDTLAEAKKQIAQVIYEGAFKGNATGDKMASPAGLQQAMKTIGTDKLKVFFTQAEIDKLNRLTRITAYANTEPAWGTVARGGNPGGVLLGGVARLAGAGSKVLPLVSPLQAGMRANSALNTSIPKTANLSPEEVANLARLLNVAGVGAGALSTPGQ